MFEAYLMRIIPECYVFQEFPQKIMKLYIKISSNVLIYVLHYNDLCAIFVNFYTVFESVA